MIGRTPVEAAPVAGPREGVDLSMIVGGDYVEAATGARYEVVDPASRRVVGSAPLRRPDPPAPPPDAAHAIAAAVRASVAWRRLPVAERAEIVGCALDAVSPAAPELAALLTREQGKPIAEAAGEIAGFVEKVRGYVRLAAGTADGRVPLLPSMRAGAFGDMAQPAGGVTVGLVAWNFPVALMAKKIGPTLLAGGTIVIKPAFTTPLTALRLIERMNAAGLPPGVLNGVTGRGEEIGAALASHAAVGRVHLTGTDETGVSVARGAAAGAGLQLDLAGSDPMIVCADADIPKALAGAVAGRYRNAGQVCTAVKRLYVATEIFDEFCRELAALVALRQPGDGLEPAAPPRVRMGPLHTAAHRDRVEAQLEDAVRRGARVVVGGRRPPDPALAAGYFFEPTVVVDVPPASRLVTEEVFGPVLPVFRTANLDDAIEQANASAWDLSASIWTSDVDAARTARSRIRCRQLWINRLSFGVS